MHLSSFRTPAALLAAVVALSLSFAAPLAARADGDDTSGVGVARISLVHGSVAVQRGDSTGPIDAVVNAPVLGGDYVTTGEGARAELQLDGTSAVRLGSGVQLRLTHLDAGNRELQLAEGTVDLRLLHGADLHAGIDTPSISIRPREAGSYRVSVDGSGQTAVTVRSGAADVVTPQGDQQLGPGTTLFASGTASNPVITSGAALAYDDFDRFNQERDQPELRAQSAENRYVDTTIDGVDDLGAYGRWVADGSYGQVWVPYDVAAGWAPYRDGRWVWEDYYGWTWVAAEPWGWAPYHYGSWYHSPAYGWAWYPPRPAYYAPVWQPALVAFISFGSGSWGGLGFGIGSGIGWVPLAPFEPYHPWWGRGYNVTNVTNVTNNYYGNVNNGNVTHVYRNTLAGGVTAIGAQRFAQGRFDHPVAVAPAQLERAAIVRGAVPVVPTEANLRFTSRATAAPQLAVRPALLQKTFAGNPAPVRRTPFVEQQSAIARVTRLPLTPAAGAARSIEPVTKRPSAATSADPWARFGQARGAAPTVRAGETGARPHAPATIEGTAPSAHTITTSTAPRTVRAYDAPAHPAQHAARTVRAHGTTAKPAHPARHPHPAKPD